jgi:hypothetical protein
MPGECPDSIEPPVWALPGRIGDEAVALVAAVDAVADGVHV